MRKKQHEKTMGKLGSPIEYRDLCIGKFGGFISLKKRKQWENHNHAILSISRKESWTGLVKTPLSSGYPSLAVSKKEYLPIITMGSSYISTDISWYIHIESYRLDHIVPLHSNYIGSLWGYGVPAGWDFEESRHLPPLRSWPPHPTWQQQQKLETCGKPP